MRWCNVCARPKHKGICDVAEMADGSTKHVSRVRDDEKVQNRWIKENKKIQMKEIRGS